MAFRGARNRAPSPDPPAPAKQTYAARRRASPTGSAGGGGGVETTRANTPAASNSRMDTPPTPDGVTPTGTDARVTSRSDVAMAASYGLREQTWLGRPNQLLRPCEHAEAARRNIFPTPCRNVGANLRGPGRTKPDQA
ncbi:hypothetical protein GCM10018775_69520 [Streptomyces umbrinus]|nr:hypothetical protein GCM10018775_69520 [Streptomyces umbrinus]